MKTSSENTVSWSINAIETQKKRPYSKKGAFLRLPAI